MCAIVSCSSIVQNGHVGFGAAGIFHRRLHVNTDSVNRHRSFTLFSPWIFPLACLLSAFWFAGALSYRDKLFFADPLLACLLSTSGACVREAFRIASLHQSCSCSIQKVRCTCCLECERVFFPLPSELLRPVDFCVLPRVFVPTIEFELGGVPNTVPFFVSNQFFVTSAVSAPPEARLLRLSQ